MAQINLSKAQKQNYGHGEQRGGCQRWGGESGGDRMEWELALADVSFYA